MKRFFTIAIVCCSCFCAFSQSNVSQSPKDELDALKGTYQLKYYDPRVMSMLPTNLAQVIKSNRKENEVVTVKLNENVEVIIYPKNKIVSPALKAK